LPCTLIEAPALIVNHAPTKQFSDVLAETAQSRRAILKPRPLASVRVSPGGHFAIAALLTFLSLVLLRTNRDLAALVLIVATWTVIPLMVVTDRVYFDGQLLFRSGLAALLSRLWQGRRPRLTLSEIERVEVATMRTLRRGGSVRYRYRIEISGRNLTFVFASGGKRFRRMINCLLPQIVDEKLDARACELRDHLIEPKELNAAVAQLGVADDSILEQTEDTARHRIEKRTAENSAQPNHEPDRARSLRKVANDLRVAGRLRESAEAFRRALHFSGREPWLIYEYARLLRSQAAAFGDARLLNRACAALRLAGLRGANDAKLLARIGESFFEFGRGPQAAKSFNRSVELDENGYRARIGLAEIALSEGKLAHVIHHYHDAARVAPDKATGEMTRREADYYSRLNEDDDYLSSELRRMNWLEGAGRVQQLAARVSFAALLVALTGSFIDQIVAGVGWALASSSIIGWSGALLTRKFLARRRGMDLGV
jgi:tetratricopeptide (TPR) repeat protein